LQKGSLYYTDDNTAYIHTGCMSGYKQKYAERIDSIKRRVEKEKSLI
jgi:hypothetical protein